MEPSQGVYTHALTCDVASVPHHPKKVPNIFSKSIFCVFLKEAAFLWCTLKCDFGQPPSYFDVTSILGRDSVIYVWSRRCHV